MAKCEMKLADSKRDVIKRRVGVAVWGRFEAEIEGASEGINAVDVLDGRADAHTCCEGAVTSRKSKCRNIASLGFVTGKCSACGREPWWPSPDVLSRTVVGCRNKDASTSSGQDVEVTLFTRCGPALDI
jgi:hypothetical protein